MTTETEAASEVVCKCCGETTLGVERGDGGHLVGMDPTSLTPDQLRAIGHQPTSPIKALRLRCIDCCSGSVVEVARCVATSCPSWPFRLGASPWRKELSETERQRRSDQAKRMRASKTDGLKLKPSNTNRSRPGIRRDA
jgi:hypothetical protein